MVVEAVFRYLDESQETDDIRDLVKSINKHFIDTERQKGFMDLFQEALNLTRDVPEKHRITLAEACLELWAKVYTNFRNFHANELDENFQKNKAAAEHFAKKYGLLEKCQALG